MGEVVRLLVRFRHPQQMSARDYGALQSKAFRVADRLAQGEAARPWPVNRILKLAGDAHESRGMRGFEIAAALGILSRMTGPEGELGSRCRDAADALNLRLQGNG